MWMTGNWLEGYKTQGIASFTKTYSKPIRLPQPFGGSFQNFVLSTDFSLNTLMFFTLYQHSN